MAGSIAQDRLSASLDSVEGLDQQADGVDHQDDEAEDIAAMLKCLLDDAECLGKLIVAMKNAQVRSTSS